MTLSDMWPEIEKAIATGKRMASDPNVPKAIAVFEQYEHDSDVKAAIATLEKVGEALATPVSAETNNAAVKDE